MSGAHTADRAAAIIAEHGETMTLARSTEATTISLKGKRIGGTIEGAGGSSARQVFRIKIAPTELLASAWTVKAPARKDTITVNSRVRLVESARPISDGDTVCLYELEVVG